MNLLLAIRWDVDPQIITLFDTIEIRWYGLLFASAFLIGQYLMLRIFKEEGKSEKDLDTLTMYMIVATVVGARLGHCLFYDPMDYLKDPISILKIWEGGLASHGAAVGIFSSIWLFVHRHKDFDYVWIADRLAIIVALAGCFIRFGNLMNSEIVGSPTDVSWAFIFIKAGSLSPEARLIPRHPAQLYESISCLILFIGLFISYWKYRASLPKGRLLGIFLIYIFGLRFFYEFLKLLL